MADFTIEAKRVRYGQDLTNIDTQARNHISQLKSLKAKIVDIKSTVNNDGDFIQADVDAVQTIIDSLLTEIATI